MHHRFIVRDVHDNSLPSETGAYVAYAPRLAPRFPKDQCWHFFREREFSTHTYPARCVNLRAPRANFLHAACDVKWEGRRRRGRRGHGSGRRSVWPRVASCNSSHVMGICFASHLGNFCSLSLWAHRGRSSRCMTLHFRSSLRLGPDDRRESAVKRTI